MQQRRIALTFNRNFPLQTGVETYSLSNNGNIAEILFRCTLHVFDFEESAFTIFVQTLAICLEIHQLSCYISKIM